MHHPTRQYVYNYGVGVQYTCDIEQHILNSLHENNLND